MYQGNFSNWVNSSGNPITIYDPSTIRADPNGTGSIRNPFPNNQIPMARFSDLSQKLIPYGAAVTPNRPGSVPGTSAYVRNNYITSSGAILSPTDKGSVRVDHTIRNNHRLAFLFNITRYRQEIGTGGPPGTPEPLYSGETLTYDSEVYRWSYDWTITLRLLNHLSIGGNHLIQTSASPNAGKNWKSKMCFKNVIDCNVDFPIVTFTEFSQWGGNAYNGTEQPNWSIKDDLSFTHATHNFKMGYAFESQRAVGTGEQTISGSAGFSFLSTSVPGATSFTSGSSFASFLLGNAFSGGTETVRAVPQLYQYHGLYFQDDWHATRRLTVNLGVRYDFTLPPINLLDQYSDFTPNRPNPAVNNYPGALRFAGFGPGRENSRSLVPGWWGGVGPRLGLAYSANDKTTIRAAFGRTFSKVAVVSGSAHFAGFAGVYTWTSPDQGITPAFKWDDGLPSYLLPPQINPSFANNQSVSYWQLHDAVRAPEDLNWTFNIQRQVTPNTIVQVGYSATVGTHLQTSVVNMNQTPTACLNQFIQQYGASQALNLLRSDVNSPHGSFVQRSGTSAHWMRHA
jgi:outer membrane receptor protein involved in Fe transport